MRACFDFLGKKNCGGGTSLFLQPCFMTLIQFVLHTEFGNFLITNIIEYDLLRLLFFGTTRVDHILLKPPYPKKTAFEKIAFLSRHESLIRVV